ncbi:hypothetical protein D3C71_1296340 [compost metagenome]
MQPGPHQPEEGDRHQPQSNQQHSLPGQGDAGLLSQGVQILADGEGGLIGACRRAQRDLGDRQLPGLTAACIPPGEPDGGQGEVAALLYHIADLVLAHAPGGGPAAVVHGHDTGGLHITPEPLHRREVRHRQQHGLGTLRFDAQLTLHAVTHPQRGVRALDLLGEAHLVGDQLGCLAPMRQGPGLEAQGRAAEADRPRALPGLNLKLQGGDLECLGKLRGDAVGEPHAKEGLAIDLLGEMAGLAAGRGNHGPRQLEGRQHGGGGKPGVHQQIHLQIEGAAHAHAVGGHQSALNADLGLDCPGKGAEPEQQYDQQGSHGAGSVARSLAASCSRNLRLRNWAGEVLRLLSQS